MKFGVHDDVGVSADIFYNRTAVQKSHQIQKVFKSKCP